MKSTQIMCAYVSVFVYCVYLFPNNILILLLLVSRVYCFLWYNSMFENFLYYCLYWIFQWTYIFQTFFFRCRAFFPIFHDDYLESKYLFEFTKFISDPIYWPTIVSFYYSNVIFVTKRAPFALNMDEKWTSSDLYISSGFFCCCIFHLLLLPLPSFTSICWKNCVLVCCCCCYYYYYYNFVYFILFFVILRPFIFFICHTVIPISFSFVHFLGFNFVKKCYRMNRNWATVCALIFL